MSKLTIDYKNSLVKVYFTYDEGQVGSCDSYGAKYEPDYPPSIDIDVVLYQGVDIMPLLDDDDLAEIESLVTEQAKKEYDGE